MKVLLWIGYVLSFGLLYLYLVKRAKRAALQLNNKLVESHTIPFAVRDFIAACGGRTNFVSLRTSPTQLIVSFAKPELVQIAALQKLGIKGINKSQNQYRFVLGNFVNQLKQQIENER
ncbi:PTS transporter subunit IIBC [Mycoplasmoides pneumoniae]|uniref:Putative phosphotransferase enzyme IIB component MPN_268 n=4 Tax=Mycoplasmoides pneumoniae TaxID=2104 RepID=Y268_MYCPN|nr:PTS transporter subunit IIBC [Mycoplasmoides pneumoniae]P75507.1 RecName: Full=Putative phosphotransferase enzyme IIB component MPN_268; AltName: Full=Putative PTS system EIIB component [Mycoplasmoides pneumoniae M129]AAB96213.1 hypothetical protein MPN_268 [Mycoplasmoides pneumoniae M129]ADK86866.1 conserved hypothetical protein [Mycoplasmoides pneumoniae FH]AGC04193.1 DNA mismatch repair protein MutT [Mycoplasmoides pneumoniae M129-B7]ALA30150.1 DNA mismatch repair protein MutT [Mycoplasm